MSQRGFDNVCKFTNIHQAWNYNLVSVDVSSNCLLFYLRHICPLQNRVVQKYMHPVCQKICLGIYDQNGENQNQQLFLTLPDFFGRIFKHWTKMSEKLYSLWAADSYTLLHTSKFKPHMAHNNWFCKKTVQKLNCHFSLFLSSVM